MRIGMMADIYRPHLSGVTNCISLYKTFLQKAGHEVFVFTFGDPQYDDGETNVLRSPGVLVPDTGFTFGLRHTRAVRRVLQSMDVVHIHHPFISGQLALRYCRPNNIPLVFTNHSRYDLFAQAYVPFLPGQVGTAVLQTYLPSLCQRVDLVIAPSKSLREVLHDLGVACRMEVIPNGVNLAPFREQTRPASRVELGLADDVLLLIYVGRLSPEKNLPFLLRAFEGVQVAFPNTALALVGDGPERDDLSRQVEKAGLTDKVRFVGLVEYNQVPRYLAMADVFVTASVAETFCLAAVEAMAVSLPVVAIDSPGLADVLVDSQAGLLSPRSLPAFTAQLARIVGDADLRREMGQNAKRVSGKYAIETVTATLVQRYRDLISARGPKKSRRDRSALDSVREILT